MLCVVLCHSAVVEFSSSVTESVDASDDNSTNPSYQTTYPPSEDAIKSRTSFESNIYVIPRSSRKLTLSETRSVVLPAVKHTSWISDALSEALWSFTPTSKTRPECNEHSALYLQRLGTQTLWAVQSKFY